jgi:sec-independent protein translocase protein TatA
VFGDILQPTHLIFILLVALVVLGPKRLPEVGKSLGRGIRDFRSAVAGIEEHAHEAFNPETEPLPAPAVTVSAEAPTALEAAPASVPAFGVEAPATVPAVTEVSAPVEAQPAVEH